MGSDWTGSFDYLNDYCKVVYLERTRNISSTMLREQNSHILHVFFSMKSLYFDIVQSPNIQLSYNILVYLERTRNISSTMLREQNSHIQRIGIIGTGRIANRFIPETKLVSGISVQGWSSL